jgi:hypothetical protein
MIDIKKIDINESNEVLLYCQDCEISSDNSNIQFYWILFDRTIVCLCQNCMKSFIDKIKNFTL